MRKIILIGVALFIFVACGGVVGESYDLTSPTDAETVHEAMVTPTEPVYFTEPPTNWNVQALTPANVRIQLANDEIWERTPSHVLFDLSRINYYHKHTVFEDGVRFVFSTEIVVRDFSLLQLGWDNGYYILYTLYTLPELTPDTPFVVQWSFLGGIATSTGFSFTCADGITQYSFAFLNSGYHGDNHPIHVVCF